MKLTEKQLRNIINDVLNEDMDPATATRTGGPPPLPKKQAPASAALPQKGALNKFKADVNMMADAASRVKEAVDGANTKEALRWLEKVVSFATSAQGVLKARG